MTTSTTTSNEVLLAALNASADFAHINFEAGHCHDLALALLEYHGAGALVMGIRTETFPGTEEVFGEWYSHCVYEDEAGEHWDISGEDAIESWESKFENNPDFTQTWNWVPVESAELKDKVQIYSVTVDELLIKDLVEFFKTL